jgi:hypothetical protein
MDTHRPQGLRAFAGRSALRRFANHLISGSLILYLATVVTHRTWVLLNSDLSQLIRRLH